MRVPEKLTRAFGEEFEKEIASFAAGEGLLPDPESIRSRRFIARSLVPHVSALSGLFNREARNQAEGLERYWHESSNPANLRLAYFLNFMPPNAYRIASIWAELHRLGYRWPHAKLQAIEFGSGPATGPSGIAAGEQYAPSGLSREGSWALIEQDRELLRLGERWAERVLRFTDAGSWEMRPFRRRIEMAKELLPRNAPEFNLWVMSFFLNELSESPDVIARKLFASWERHLEDEGLVILVEPALKLQSRRLLEIRKQLLEHFAGPRAKDFQILLPCLGHQACGALAAAEDWCHEEVAWWRPPYLKIIDEMAGLDRKTLPFSYLVITRSKRTREEILPALAEARGEAHRLVSPAHDEGRDLEFFMCGKDGKRRARYRAEKGSLSRGDILLGAEIQGAPEASRIKKISGCVP